MERDAKPKTQPSCGLTDEEVEAGAALFTILAVAGLSELSGVQYTSTALRAQASILSGLSRTARFVGEYEAGFEGASIGAAVTTFTLGGPTWIPFADVVAGVFARAFSRTAGTIEATRVRVVSKLRRRNAEAGIRGATNLVTGFFLLLILAAMAASTKR